MTKLKQMMTTLAAFAVVVLGAGMALAEEGAAATGQQGAMSAAELTHSVGGGMVALAVAIGIGIAALGGTIGQGRTASAALEGIARNPNAAERVFVPMILGLAFIESLVLFTWVLMLLLQVKL